MQIGSAGGRDFASLSRYREENASIISKHIRPDVVFIGDSITERWKTRDSIFRNKRWINRGISGQTTAQMLIRFQQDVISLRPDIVHIMGGTNDIRGNGGSLTIEDVENNIHSMVELAKHHGIIVVLASVPPADTDPARPQVQFPEAISELNYRLSAYARDQQIFYADYWKAMKSDSEEMRTGIALGIHPNARGYEIMDRIASDAIRKAAASKR